MKNVSKQWTVLWALSPYMQVKSLPVITNLRQLKLLRAAQSHELSELSYN